MSEGGYTKGYKPAGVIHGGQYVFPAPFDYPKWTHYIWPKRLRSLVRRHFRTYNPDKDLFLRLTGKRLFDE